MTPDPAAFSDVSRAPPRELYVEGARARALRDELPGLPTWDLGEVQALDLGLLLDGSFAPLDGYMGRAALRSVAQSMRLPDGRLWPMPLSLDVDAATARALRPGGRLALRHAEGMVLAVVHVEDVFEIDVPGEARALFGTDETSHPGVFRHLRETTPWRVAGRVEGLEAPPSRAPSGAATSPREVRRGLAALGHERVVAFQTRNPLHRAHLDLTLRALEAVDGTLLLHPVVGRTAPGDVPAAARLRCYEAVLPRFPAGRVLLAALPLAMRMAGPREALWHALIRRNHGATHFIVGRDHAAPGPRPDGRPFYGPYDAQRLLASLGAEPGVTILPMEERVCLPDGRTWLARSEVPAGVAPLACSGTELRRLLREGTPLPEWFTVPEVESVLREAYPPRRRQGFALYLTGLSGAGKSTLAKVLTERLEAIGPRRVTVLDGDHVRKLLSAGLGFTKEDRETNLRRIAFVAAEVVRHGGIAVCAAIAPYRAARCEAREQVEALGGFVEIHVATPIATCEARDRKGLYAKARAGLLRGFTGIDDPYEPPERPEVTVFAAGERPGAAAEAVIAHLVREGYLPG